MKGKSENGVVLDVGANVSMASFAWGLECVHLNLFLRICRGFILIELVVLFEAAVSDGIGNITFHKLVGQLDNSAVSASGAKLAFKSNEEVELQRYDPDPAAKAAAASVLASKLGMELGLKVYLDEESVRNNPVGKSNDSEFVLSKGIRNRKQSHCRSSSTGSGMLPQFMEEAPSDMGFNGVETPHNRNVVVEDHPTPTVHDGGWIDRIAALLVGEDPTQSYALVRGSCHMHNWLARKDDFSLITYYCLHCHGLNCS